jgi:hypothetical protein
LTTLNAAVFLFGVLVSALVGAGILVLFYGHAYLEQAKRANTPLSPRTQRFLETFLGQEAP